MDFRSRHWPYSRQLSTFPSDNGEERLPQTHREGNVLSNGVVFLLLVSGLLGSVWLWCGIIVRWSRQLPALTRREELRPAVPLLAVLASLGWTGINLVDKCLAAGRTDLPAPTPSLVMTSALLTLGVFLTLVGLLFIEGRWQPRDAGFRRHEWRASLELGAAAFLVAVLPTGLALIASLPFRSRETQHRLLQVLQEYPDPWLIVGLAMTAVVLAPLCEELLFRVTLQTWLVSWCGPQVAIPAIAALFAAIHGWRDSFALLPLSLILGYVYERRHDYFAVVTAHGLFNLTNLLLALLADPSSSA